MKRGRDGGYTIVEVMVVLAVTAGLFVATALLLTGKQGKTEFQQGVREYEAKLQSVISDVGSSYFPGGIKCVASSSGQPALYPGTAEDPATKAGCIFLGKAFMNNNEIRTMIGRHYKEGTTSQEVADLDESLPNTDPALNETYSPTYGLTLTRIRDIRTHTDLDGVAFFNELGVSNSSGEDISGSRSMVIYALNGDPTNITSYNDVDEGVVFCLRGANNQNAEITVGARGGSSSIYTTMDTGTGQC